MDGSPPLGAHFGMCAQPQVCTGDGSEPVTSPATCTQKEVIVPQSSREFLPAWDKHVAWPKCLPETQVTCSSSFSVAGIGGSVGMVKGMSGLCLSRMGAGRAEKYRYRDPLPVSFYSLSLTFKFSITT